MDMGHNGLTTSPRSRYQGQKTRLTQVTPLLPYRVEP